ncbi:MAG: MBL fold metallo-hydrolase [Candidatus Binataceae bacterium]|nr:MBL fold metallo-hydrolase [Candidatus Binataceae bacterium]
MIAAELNHAKCKSYLLVSEADGKSVIIDPVREKIDRYLAALAYHRRHLELIIDTHTHADHRTGAFELSELTGAPVAMHRKAPAPHVTVHLQDGQWLSIGGIRMQVLYTPGHTPDSISLFANDRVFTGDVLLIHGTGRADFAGGDPAAQYDSIMQKLFTMPDETLVFPAHDYRGHTQSTIGEEKHTNPRIANRSRDQYVELMNNLGLPLPNSIQEALQPNQAAIDADAISFPTLAQLDQVRQLSTSEVSARLTSNNPPILIDVREPDEFSGELGHIRGSRLIPLRELPERAGELSEYKNRELVVICRAGARSTTAAAILTGLGFENVANLKGGMLDWSDAQLPVER